MHHLGYQTCVKSTWLHHIVQNSPTLYVTSDTPKVNVTYRRPRAQENDTLSSQAEYTEIATNKLFGSANGLLPLGTKPLSYPTSFKQTSINQLTHCLLDRYATNQ